MSTVHKDFVSAIQRAGLEDLATKLGVMTGGEIKALVNSSATNPADSDGDEPVNPTEDGSKGENSRKRPREESAEAESALSRAVRQSTVKVMRFAKDMKTPFTADDLESKVLKDVLTGVPESQAKEIGDAVRSRVENTLNVLLAVGALSQVGNEAFKWKSLPFDSASELEVLKKERDTLLQEISSKKQHLEGLVTQSIALKNLVEMNKKRAEEVPQGKRIQLPFVVVSTNKDTVIECEMAENQSDIFFNFDRPFELHDDTEVLKRLNLHMATRSSLESFLPAPVLNFVPPELILPEDVVASPAAVPAANEPVPASPKP